VALTLGHLEEAEVKVSAMMQVGDAVLVEGVV
jgi:hypothetical protein